MRTYKRKTERGNISRDVYEKAVATLQEDKTKKIRTVAKDFGICHVTLGRYLYRRKEAEEKGMAIETVRVGYQKNRQVFSDEQEKNLVNDCIQYSKNNNLTPKVIRHLAFAYASKNNITMPGTWLVSKEAGSYWLTGFLKRNESLLKEFPMPSQTTSFNTKNIDIYFLKLAEVIETYKFSPSRIWNIDEIGLNTVQKTRKILLKESSQIGPITSAERGSVVILCIAANAAGNSLPCMFVFPRIKYRNCLIQDGPENCIGAGNSSNWMTKIEFNIFMEHFIKNVKPSPDDPVLLLLDNLSCHLDVEVIKTAKENNVVIQYFPPHSSFRLQPLYVGVYGPLKTYYESQQDAWLQDNPGKIITIHDIPYIVKKALPLAMNPTNIINGFKRSGIVPFNETIFQNADFLSTIVTDGPFNDTADLYLENIAVDVQSTSLQIAETPFTLSPHSAQNTASSNSIITENASELTDIKVKTENSYTFAGCSTYPNGVECNVSSKISQPCTETPILLAVAPETNTLEKSVFIKQENASEGENSAEETGNIVIKREVLQELVENEEENYYLQPIRCEAYDLKER